MQFDSFSAFLDMGGYGFYVWLSFGVSAALLLALLINSLMGHKHTIKKIALRQQRENKLRQLRTKRNENTTNTHNEVTE